MSPSIDSLKCIQCNCMESMLWKLVGDNQHLCIDCSDQSKTNGKIESESNRKPDEKRGKLRKSTRSTRYNGKIGSNGTSNSTATTTSNSTKSNNVKPSGRGRRNLFRRQPIKAPTIPATTRNVKSLFYKGSYIQIGDIVSLCNSKYDIFYAQIRGLMIDSFCEKSAVITWLLPTQSSPAPNDGFDPSTYVIGPEEDQPRLLSCMEFVMHAPSDYYYNKTTPYPPLDNDNYNSMPHSTGGYIWTSIDSINIKPKD